MIIRLKYSIFQNNRDQQVCLKVGNSEVKLSSGGVCQVYAKPLTHAKTIVLCHWFCLAATHVEPSREFGLQLPSSYRLSQGLESPHLSESETTDEEE